MSVQLGNLISHILVDYFGDIVQKVGCDLFRFGSKSIPLIMMTTKLPKNQIKKSLCTLIKYGFVTFISSENDSAPEYKICYDAILALLQYPKFILHIKNRYGNEAELIIEEVLREGTLGTQKMILNIMTKTKDDKEKNVSIVGIRDTLISLATAGYIVSLPLLNDAPVNSSVPLFKDISCPLSYLHEIDIRTLSLKLNDDSVKTVKDEYFWKVDIDRFHQDFRDELLITATTRMIDECGGELMRVLLQMMYMYKEPWAPISKPISFIELKDCCVKSSKNPLLGQYLLQYLNVLEESSQGFVTQTNDSGGGQYTLKLAQASESLVWDLLSSTVQERLGTKAARIFRLVKEKKYIEEDDIQRNAMIPAKEAKQLTYKLLEEHFIEIQALRKSASANAGPAKAFYLYYIDLHNVTNMLLESTYKVLYNIISRREHERSLNKWLIEKQQRVDIMVHTMKLRAEPEETIQDIEETVTPPEKLALEKITAMINKLDYAELNLCETMFILQIYFVYKNKKNKN